MSKPVTITKRRLYSYAHQITEWQRMGKVEYELMKGRINDFYKENAIYLQSIERDIKTIEEHFFVHDGDKVKIEGDGKDAQPVFQDGKNQYSFDRNWTEMMNQIVGTKYKVQDYAPEPVESVAIPEPEVAPAESPLKIAK